MRKALLVGVNNYDDDSLRNLTYSVKDAALFQAFFYKLGFECELLADPKRGDFMKKVEDMVCDLVAGDVFLLFFAGHGFTSSNGEHLLFCSDDRQKLVRTNGAGTSTNTLSLLAGEGGFHRAFIIDACRTDAFAADARGNPGAAGVRRDIVDALNPDGGRPCNDASVVMIRSCDQWQPAIESKKIKQGLFTKAFIDVAEGDFGHGASLCLDQDFVSRVSKRMHEFICEAGIEASQRPKYEVTGDAIVLWDGDADPERAPGPGGDAPPPEPRPAKPPKAPRRPPPPPPPPETCLPEDVRRIIGMYRTLLFESSELKHHAEDGSGLKRSFKVWQKTLLSLGDKGEVSRLIATFGEICEAHDAYGRGEGGRPFFIESRRNELELRIRRGAFGANQLIQSILSSLEKRRGAMQ